MTARRRLTDRFVRSAKPAPTGKRLHFWDDLVIGLGLRVTDAGSRSYILYTRYPPTMVPARRALGDAGKLTLDSARHKARVWLDLIAQGKDPAVVEEEERRRERERLAATFGAVAEDYITKRTKKQRQGAEVERTIRRVLLPLWKDDPVTSITRQKVRKVIEGVRDSGTAAMLKAHGATPPPLATRRGKRRRPGPAPGQARNLLGIVKQVFGFAVDEESYGLDISPAAALSAKKLFGRKRRGDRVLNDDEVRALWHSADAMGYPHGRVYQLLLLTALRLNEAADAARREFDLAKRQWIIPASRMKGNSEEARPHLVPLSDDAMTLLTKVQKEQGSGKFVFSADFGKKPVWMSSKIKRDIDDRMLAHLRDLAEQHGDDPAEVELPPWTNHDIRRTVRSNLSSLRVAEEVREAVLAHARPGIIGTYDLHDYADEKREALELWAARLRSIVDPEHAPSNVVQMASKGRSR